MIAIQQIKIYLISFCILSLHVGCKSTKRAIGSKSNTSTIKQSSVRYSEINIPVSISKALLSKSLDTTLDSILFDYGNQKVEGIDLEIMRRGNSLIEMNTKDILSTIPLKLEVSKNLLMTEVRAEGVVELVFSTNVDIDPYWNIVTKTEIVDHEWIEPMRMKSGFGGISIESIANKIIDNSKDKLCKQIDETLNKQLKFQEQINDFANQIRQPIKIHELYDGFIQISPDTIQLADFKNTYDAVSSVLSINVNSKLHAYKPDVESFRGLPRFEWTQSESNKSKLALPIEITYKQLESLVKSYLVGQIFESDGRSITIKDMSLTRDGQYIAAIVDVIGSFDGQLYLTGRPNYNKQKKELYASDVEINVKTKNIIQKAAAWIAKGVIKNRLEQEMVFSLDDQVTTLEGLINDTFANLTKETPLTFRSNIEAIDIDQFLLLDDYIQATLLIDGVIDGVIE